MKGSQAKVGETNRPFNEMSTILDKMHYDFIKLFDERQDEAEDLFRKAVPAYDDISVASNRKLFNFKSLGGDTGFIRLVNDLYSNEFVLANANHKIDKANLESLVKDYIGKFYEANLQDKTKAGFSIENLSMGRSFIGKIRDEYCLSVLRSYRKSLDFDEMIYIGEDRVLHVFRRRRQRDAERDEAVYEQQLSNV